jgi:hypothetical protein
MEGARRDRGDGLLALARCPCDIDLAIGINGRLCLVWMSRRRVDYVVIVEMIVVVILVAIVVGGSGGRVSMVYVGMNRVLLFWRLLM